MTVELCGKRFHGSPANLLDVNNWL